MGGVKRKVMATSTHSLSEAREVMSLRQASLYLGVSADTMYRYVSEGMVPAFKLGNRWKLRKSVLDRWMERKMSQPKSKRRKTVENFLEEVRPKASERKFLKQKFLNDRKGLTLMRSVAVNKKQLVGLDIGSSSIKAVELKASRQGYELVSYGIEELAQDAVVDGAIMDAPLVAAGIANIFEKQNIKTKNVATAVSGHSVIVKRVPLPLMTEEELYDRIQAEASQHYFSHSISPT